MNPSMISAHFDHELCLRWAGKQASHDSCDCQPVCQSTRSAEKSVFTKPGWHNNADIEQYVRTCVWRVDLCVVQESTKKNNIWSCLLVRMVEAHWNTVGLYNTFQSGTVTTINTCAGQNICTSLFWSNTSRTPNSLYQMWMACWVLINRHVFSKSQFTDSVGGWRRPCFWAPSGRRSWRGEQRFWESLCILYCW